MSFLESFFTDFFSPWFWVDGLSYGILDILWFSLPFCIIAGIVVTVLENRRRN